ncbi:YjbH domain-containing protein [Pseudomonadota bacterium]|nr:YjbH domain-containing protein [Pseudomonadota bacterium]
MRHSFMLAVIYSLTASNAYTQIADYIYPHFSDPTYSNYGTVGLIQMPSARMHPGGTVGFTWTHADPYLRGSIMGHPFDWFEASYQYTDVNNFLYSDSPEFSGKQSYKDKSFDAKFRIIKERALIPQVAVGFRDFGGSALFAAEYIVASKLIGNVDFTLGLGFGTISNKNVINPLARLDSRFKSRDRNVLSDTQGGEINFGKFFGGEKAGLFGGVEIFLPKLNGTRLKIEYDTTNYLEDGEGYLPVSQDGKFNYSFVYPISKNFHVKIGYVRNNTLSFGFSIAGNYGQRNSTLITKNDPPAKIENAEIFRKIVNAEKAENLYKSSLSVLRENNLYLQTANVDKNRYEITFSQSKYLNNAQALGRMANILNEISPDVIEEFSLVTINADQSMFAVDIPRAGYNLYKEAKKTDALLEEVRIYKPDPKQHLDHDYRPQPILPSFMYKISPAIRSQIGGPDGFYFGDLSLSIHSETLIKKNFNIMAVASVGLINNFDELKLASDSIIPHVRTDIVSYLKASKKSHITRLQANYFGNPYKSIYTKISAGIFEPMFAGYGGEILYKPFGQSFGIGAEIWKVKQRSYRQLFRFRDYETVTGHMNFYYREPRSRVLFHLRGGRYLAEDSGFTFNVSRDFKSGLNMGVFFSLTDISKAEFGEGSFDKGFFFNLPIQLFFQEYSRGQTGFGLRPLTRDGAQFLVHAQNLWSTTYQANEAQIINEWDGFYD